MSLSGDVWELDLITKGEMMAGVFADSYGQPTHVDGRIYKVGNGLEIGKGLLLGTAR